MWRRKMSKIKISNTESDGVFLKIEDRLGMYLYLINVVDKVDVAQDRDFQNIYSTYFTFRGKMWTESSKYFNFMQQRKNDNTLTFETVLKCLSGRLGFVTPSFSSKLLSMINPDKPVWDSEVLKKLDMKAPSHGSKERIKRIGDLYTEIGKEFDDYLSTVEARERIKQFKGWYKGFLSREEAKRWTNRFYERFPHPKYAFKTNLTDVKIIDLILWQKNR